MFLPPLTVSSTLLSPDRSHYCMPGCALLCSLHSLASSFSQLNVGAYGGGELSVAGLKVPREFLIKAATKQVHKTGEKC